MYWFKNLMAYRLTSQIDFSQIETALQANKYTECQSSEASKFGWSAPLCTSEQLYFEASGQILLVACKEEKILPPLVIKKETENRLAELEKKEGRKLKKIEKLGIKDDVIAALLPRAFSKHQFTAIWIDSKLGYVYVDTNSAKRAEDVLALLRKSLGSLPVVLLSFNSQPNEIMTYWLKENNVPDWLTLQEEGRLKSTADNSEATFRHQDLESEEIETHLLAGKYVSRLALDWENHLSFTLSEDGTISKIKFADDIREKNDDILKEDVAQRFDADFYLMTQELDRLMENLATEFDGVKERE
ncbi:recombination-associated protein RdgC [Haemophilus haemoglobinophilus]|nr:recombination-associated protein RdgC [Canicola haemoglobinophilus]MBN6711611.1 recombination-associated protein RdgC [Canicola haemoglobinophilus]